MTYTITIENDDGIIKVMEVNTDAPQGGFIRAIAATLDGFAGEE